MNPTPPPLTDDPQDAEPVELQEAVLDHTTVMALFDDLEACTEVLDVIMKGGPESRTIPGTVSLRTAQQFLLTDKVPSVQVRYRFEGTEWRDTLMQTNRGWKLVRMAMPW